MYRKYTLTRIRKGDYLLLSNDESTLWRIATYDEDGSAVTSEGREIRGTFWGLWKFRGKPTGDIRVDDWNEFEMWSHLMRSREEAIKEALRCGTK